MSTTARGAAALGAPLMASDAFGVVRGTRTRSPAASVRARGWAHPSPRIEGMAIPWPNEMPHFECCCDHDDCNRDPHDNQRGTNEQIDNSVVGERTPHDVQRVANAPLRGPWELGQRIGRAESLTREGQEGDRNEADQRTDGEQRSGKACDPSGSMDHVGLPSGSWFWFLGSDE